MNMVILVLATAVIMLTEQNTYALIYSTNNLIQNGGFEDDGIWTYFGTGATNSTTHPYEGSYSLELVRGSYWQGAEQTITIFRNRTYYYSSKFGSNGTYVNPNQMYIDGVQVFSISGYSSGAWRTGYGPYLIPGSGQDDVTFKITSAMDQDGEIGYWDSISLRMERSTPVVTTNSLTGDVPFSAGTVFNIYNNGGSYTNNYAINFDPDITINAASNVISVSISWISDTNAQITISPSVAGPLTLSITNERSDSSYEFKVNVAQPIGTAIIIK